MNCSLTLVCLGRPANFFNVVMKCGKFCHCYLRRKSQRRKTVNEMWLNVYTEYI